MLLVVCSGCVFVCVVDGGRRLNGGVEFEVRYSENTHTNTVCVISTHSSEARGEE